jgi:hypothetical protein
MCKMQEMTSPPSELWRFKFSVNKFPLSKNQPIFHNRTTVHQSGLCAFSVGGSKTIDYGSLVKFNSSKDK